MHEAIERPTGPGISSRDLERFEEKGWIVVRLPHQETIHRARAEIESRLLDLVGSCEVTPENYHEFVDDDVRHTEIQFALTSAFRELELGQQIIRDQLDLFRGLFGPDLNVAKQPYLRVTRPSKKQDNTGYHRGTFYTEWGGHFEFPVWIPYTDAPAGSGLYAIPGSHKLAARDVRHQRVQSPDVVKGSIRHQMGFSYAPKIIDADCLERLEPVPVMLGEAMIFQHSLVHGTVENTSTQTRWSSDTRIVNAWAPIDLKMRPDYYDELCRSASFRMIQRYEKQNSSPC